MCMKNTKAGGIKELNFASEKENEIIDTMYLSPFIATKMGGQSGIFFEEGVRLGIGNEGQCKPFQRR